MFEEELFEAGLFEEVPFELIVGTELALELATWTSTVTQSSRHSRSCASGARAHRMVRGGGQTQALRMFSGCQAVVAGLPTDGGHCRRRDRRGVERQAEV